MAAVTPSRWRLDGARAVVTGGTKGIGLAVTRELVDLGASVLVAARGEARLDPDLDAAAKDARLHFVQADVATAAGRGRVRDSVASTWGALDILADMLVNTARTGSVSPGRSSLMRTPAGRGGRAETAPMAMMDMTASS